MKREEFEAQQRAIPDDKLVEMAQNALSKLCETGGRSLTMTVPPRVDDTDMIISELIRRFKDRHTLPPAEGAEEILAKYLIRDPISKRSALEAMHEFATLRAQKIADKMVSERLRGKFLLAYDELRDLCCRFFRHWWNSPGANTEEGFDTWAEMNNLKSRDNDSKS